MKELEISLKYVRKTNDIMDDIIRLFGYEDIEINQTSSNTYEWEVEGYDPVEDAIIESFEKAGIESDEYWFNEL